METRIDFFKRPGKAQAVLAHFQTRGGDAAGIRRFGRAERDVVFLEICDGFRRRRHIGALCNVFAAVGNQCFRTVKVEFVLCGARKRDIARDSPDTLAAFGVDSARNAFGVFRDAGTFNFFDLLDDVKVDAFFIDDIAVRVAHGDDFGAELRRLLVGINRHIAGAGDNNPFALEAVARFGKHFIGKVAETKAGGFFSGKRTACAECFAGQNTGEFVAKTFILAEHIADFTGADTNVASRDVCICADMLGKLRHEGLAETHDFAVALALRVKVGTAFAAAHREAGQAVFENLFKAQEFDDGGTDARMQAQTALVRPNG